MVQGGQAQPHPSPDSLGCPSATGSGKWALQLESGLLGTLCCVPGPALGETLHLRSPRNQAVDRLTGVGGEDAALSKNFPLQLINPMGEGRAHGASSVGPQLQAQHPVDHVGASGAPRIGVVQPLGASPAADWASVWWGGSCWGVTAGWQPPGCLSLLGSPAPGWPLPKPPTPWRSGMCPK